MRIKINDNYNKLSKDLFNIVYIRNKETVIQMFIIRRRFLNGLVEEALFHIIKLTILIKL